MIDLTPIPEFDNTPEGQQAKQKYLDKEREEAEQRRLKDANDRKSRLKRDGSQLNLLSNQLAALIPSANGGMSVSGFKKFAESFEEGHTKYTPDTTDTPYSEPYSQRPKIRILSEGTNYQ
jgi:hypothetical protein